MGSTVTFVGSIFDLKNLPKEGLPEVAFIGRSNVGKSSLINALAGKKNLARTSAEPGKTQSLNFYRFGDSYSIVDTPGYGYARRSASSRAAWDKLMDSYISERPDLAAVAIVIDIRHPGLENDVAALEWLSDKPVRCFAVLTKSDKVNASDRNKHENYLKSGFSRVERVFSVSSLRGAGISSLREFIAQLTSMS